MTIRSLARAVTPPIVIELVRKRTDRRPTSWDAACKIANSYDAELVNRFRADRAALRPVDGSLLQASILSLVARMIGNECMSVTDLGGAAGDLAADFLRAWPDANDRGRAMSFPQRMSR